MADRVIVVGSREYTLRLDFERVTLVEERLGKSFFDCEPNRCATDMTVLAYYASDAYDDGLSLAEFRENLTRLSFTTVMEKVDQAIERFIEGPNPPDKKTVQPETEPEDKKKEGEDGDMIDVMTGTVEAEPGKPLHKGG